MAIALKQASETMFYAPMVCMMFVGFRMRVRSGSPHDPCLVKLRSESLNPEEATVLARCCS